MTLNVISTKYRRSAVGIVMLGSLLSFALGQHVGHGRTPTLNVARTHGVPIVNARASGDIGTVVPQTSKPATTVPLGTSASVTFQGGHTEQKHGHEHGKGDSLVTLVTINHSAGEGDHAHQDGSENNGGGQND